MDPYYVLNILVTEQGTPFYPSVGTKECVNGDNAGYDVRISSDITSSPVAFLAPLGIKVQMQKVSPVSEDIQFVTESHFSLEPRSSIYKTGFMMANSRGIIDKTYRGELMAPLVSVGSVLGRVAAGTRLFQILAPDMGHIKYVYYVNELPETVRGSGGFGSTGTV